MSLYFKFNFQYKRIEDLADVEVVFEDQGGGAGTDGGTVGIVKGG